MTLPDNGQPMLLLDAAGIAQVAELPVRETEGRARPVAATSQSDEREDMIQALIYRELNGRERLLPLAVVDRVEDLEPSQITSTDGLAFARIEDRLLPALNTNGVETGSPKSLRLHDGHDQICYLIDDVVDIIEVPAKVDVRLAAGRIAGLVMVGDTQLEMVDPFMLFAEAAGRRATARSSRPIQCLIADAEDPWMRTILAPLLIQAGHDVTYGGTGEGSPDVILCSDAQAVCPTTGDIPVVALREIASPGAGTPDSIYRYDRETIMAAIAQAARRAA
jgi:two-component system chemotaxis sensor kinase CheA